MSDIDAVAEAIWRADDDGSVIRRTLAKFHDWSNVSAAQQDRYRRMAQAATDALQLTITTEEQLADLPIGSVILVGNGLAAFIKSVDSCYDPCWVSGPTRTYKIAPLPVRLLLHPSWVRVDGGDDQ